MKALVEYSSSSDDEDLSVPKTQENESNQSASTKKR